MRLTIDNLAYYNPSEVNLNIKGDALVSKPKTSLTINGNTIDYTVTSAEKASLGSGAVYVQVKCGLYKTEIIKIKADDVNTIIQRPLALMKVSDERGSWRLTATITANGTKAGTVTDVSGYKYLVMYSIYNDQITDSKLFPISLLTASSIYRTVFIGNDYGTRRSCKVVINEAVNSFTTTMWTNELSSVRIFLLK